MTLNVNHDQAVPRFSNKWFEVTAKRNWQSILPQLKPRRVLEIGTFEGQATCHLISSNDWCDHLEVYCIDTWEGGVEHQARDLDMGPIEQAFDRNVAAVTASACKNATVNKLKGYSSTIMAHLIAANLHEAFDFIYVDGSHQAPDVLTDAVMAFPLLRVNGIIGFDDYTWSETLSYGKDPLRCPKPAVDAFTNIFFRKISLLNAPLSQVYAKKIAP